jgi:hypothetical protein
MGMKEIELRWTVKVGDAERQLLIKRHAGWFHDMLSLDLDGNNIFTSAAGGFSAGTGAHEFRVDDTKFCLYWKWSALSGNPKYLILRSRNLLIRSYGDYKEGEEQSTNRRTTDVVIALIFLGFVVAAVATNPSEEHFRRHIRSEIRSETDAFTNLLLGGVTTEVLIAATKRTDLYVCSLYKTQIDNARETRLGAFGRIWGPFKL